MDHHRDRRGRERQDERGAVVPLVAIMLSVLLGITALTVDLGVQRVARTDMQSLADMVALDMARQLTGGTVSSYSAAALNAARDASVQRNRTVDNGEAIDNASVTWQLGKVTSGVFSPLTAPTATPTAVRVTATTSIGFHFTPGRGEATRSAVAVSSAGGCFKMGSFLVGLDSGSSAVLNPLLGNLLGTTATAGVLGYQGLATSSVSLGSLAVALGAGTPEGLVNQAAISYQNFFLAAVTALQADHPDQTANIALLNTIRGNLGSLGTIKVSDLISVAGGSNDAASTAQVNLLDLVEGAALIATPTGGITVPGLALTVPGVTGIAVKLNVVEPPQIGCGLAGSAAASTSQVRLTVTGNISAVGLVSGSFSLTLNLANADGLLSSIGCTVGSATSEVVGVTTLNAASTVLTMTLSTVLLGNIAKVDVSAGTPKSPATYTLPLPSSYTTAVTTGSSPTALPAAAAGNVTVLGLPLGLTVGTLLSAIVNPVITGLNSLITGQLTSALGLRIAGADLFAIATPTCSGPRMLGLGS